MKVISIRVPVLNDPPVMLRIRFECLFSTTLLQGSGGGAPARGPRKPGGGSGGHGGAREGEEGGSCRGLHSSTFQLNLSRF